MALYLWNATYVIIIVLIDECCCLPTCLPYSYDRIPFGSGALQSTGGKSRPTGDRFRIGSSSGRAGTRVRNGNSRPLSGPGTVIFFGATRRFRGDLCARNSPAPPHPTSSYPAFSSVSAFISAQMR